MSDTVQSFPPQNPSAQAAENLKRASEGHEELMRALRKRFAGMPLSRGEEAAIDTLVQLKETTESPEFQALTPAQQQLVLDSATDIAKQGIQLGKDPEIEKKAEEKDKEGLIERAKKLIKGNPVYKLIEEAYFYPSDLPRMLKQQATPFMNQLKAASPMMAELFNAMLNGLQAFGEEKGRTSGTDSWLKAIYNALGTGGGQFGVEGLKTKLQEKGPAKEGTGTFGAILETSNKLGKMK